MAGINVTSLSSSLTGSTFDWQSFVDQIVSIDSAPITALQTTESNNSDKLAALNAVNTDLTDLQTATKALSAQGLFTGRTVSSSTSGSTWGLSTASGTVPGSYAFNVTHLATASQRTGALDIGQGLSAIDDVSGLTIASLSTATAVTAGNFTVNGAQVSIGLTDSLKDVFNKINTATGGAVTASYDHTTDKISFISSSEIVLGASNDSSNFLAISRLTNNGTGALTSASSLGTVNTSAMLSSSKLTKAITAVDGSGNGSFSLNGVSIAYNVNTDSLTSVMNKINNSTAGITATYDATNDRMVLTNKTTGDVGMSLTEATGGLLDALGVSTGTTGAAMTRGTNAQFSINGGPTLTSTSNTFDGSVTGINGLSVTPTTEGAQTVTVASNTDAMKTAIQSFLDKYNVVQSFIDSQTSIAVNNGTVSTSLLSNNREVQDWASSLRSKAFSAVSGLSGTVKQLADLGIDFQGTSSQLTIRDSSKLATALTSHSDDVQAFFTTASTGFIDTMNTYLGKLLGTDGTGTDGEVAIGKNTLTSQNSGIDVQIAAIQRTLDSERTRLTAGFEAMQAAQQQSKSMIQALTSTFGTTSSS